MQTPTIPGESLTQKKDRYEGMVRNLTPDILIEIQSDMLVIGEHPDDICGKIKAAHELWLEIRKEEGELEALKHESGAHGGH